MSVGLRVGDALGGFFRGMGSGMCAWFGGTGEARLRGVVSKDRWCKPMVKSAGAQRESDGVVVPVIAMQQNVAGGKGPEFGLSVMRVSVRVWPGPPGPITP